MRRLVVLTILVPFLAACGGTSGPRLNEGVGDVTLGLSPTEVIRAIGARPAQTLAGPLRGQETLVFFDHAQRLPTIVTFDSRGRAARIITYNPALRTDLGNVGVGSTKAAVEKMVTGGRWLRGPVPTYWLRLAARTGDRIANLLVFNGTGKVKLVAVVDRTTLSQ
jgi:hypothetical protein